MPLSLDATERERGAAMHAKLVEDVDTTQAVAERNKSFPEQGDAQRIAVGTGQLLGDGYGCQ